MTGHLRPTSTRAQAVRYLRAMDTWVSSADLATHLGIKRKDVTAALSVAIARGDVAQRKEDDGSVSWRFVGAAEVPTFALDWPPGFVSQFARHAA